MGTWGAGVFENDIACDFALAVAGGGGMPTVLQALERVLSSGDDYLEAPDAEEGLAAADIIARLKGNWGPQTAYTQEVDGWVSNQSMPIPDKLLAKAKQTVTRIITEPSELLELWSETAEFSSWKRHV